MVGLILSVMFGACFGMLASAAIFAGARRRCSAAAAVSTPALAPFELERGIVAYEAYRRGCAGLDPTSRARLPEWRELHPEIQTVWATVADVLCSRYGAIY